MNERTANSRPSLSLADGHIALGNVYRSEDNLKDALAEYDKAIDSDSTSATAHAMRGSALIDSGRFSEAIESLETAIELQPDYAAPYRDLGSLARNGEYELTDVQIHGIEDLLSDDDLPPEEACDLRYTLGDTFDARGDCDAAFQAYDLANASRHQSLLAAGSAFNAELFEATVEATIETFDESYFRNAKPLGLESDLPIFVVGMPRSGTTLTEQILASHPNVLGVGERPEVAFIATELPERIGGQQPYPACIHDLEPALAKQLADQYLEGLVELDNKISRFVDKTPTNFLFLGLILGLFPRARFIHCIRDPRDVAVSCYFQTFASVEWSYRLEDIGLFYRGYTRVMQHWNRVLPGRIHDVTYEELVANTETICREMVAFTGLPWSDTCLDYHRQRSTVRTASRVQVRQPIYTNSVARWKRYASHLTPLDVFLGPPST